MYSQSVTFKPKLAVFDLDGTLAESKQRMTQEMGELLSALLEKMPVAVMSGAAFKQFEVQFLPALPDNAQLERLYLFPVSAAQCYIFDTGKWRTHYDHSFTEMERKTILIAFDEAIKEAGLSEEPPQTWGERVEDRGAEIVFSALGQQAPLEKKEEWHSTQESKRDLLREALAKRLPGFSISEGGLTTVQVNPKGINKSYGIRQLVEMSGISVSEMLYVGDALGEGGNDAVVIESGVQTRQVFGPEETAALIKELLN